jgi:hypothetical protein
MDSRVDVDQETKLAFRIYTYLLSFYIYAWFIEQAPYLLHVPIV